VGLSVEEAGRKKEVSRGTEAEIIIRKSVLDQGGRRLDGKLTTCRWENVIRA